MKRKNINECILFLPLLFLMLTGCGGISESSLKAVVDDTLVSGDTYEITELLYYYNDTVENIDPTVRYQYNNGAIMTIDALSGETLSSDSGDKAYAEVDEAAWRQMFYSGLEPDISSYEKRIEFTVSDSHRVYFMDDEMWLGIFNNGTMTALFKVSKV